MNRFFSSLILLSAAFSSSLFGWCEVSHRAIALLAYERLDPEVKEKVDGYIKAFSHTFPEYSTLDSAAIFPDDMKDQGLFIAPHGIDFVYDPTHYLTDSEKERLSILSEKGTVVNTINYQIATLKNPKATPFAKGWAVTYLTHLVADLHQPLHACSLFSEKFPKGDIGGSLFKIKNQGKIISLHTFWDQMCGLVSCKKKTLMAKRAYADQLKKEIAEAFPDQSLKEETLLLDPKKWAEESYALAVQVAREGVVENEPVTECYTKRGQKVSKERVALSGYRLAYLLNTILKEPSPNP